MVWTLLPAAFVLGIAVGGLLDRLAARDARSVRHLRPRQQPALRVVIRGAGLMGEPEAEITREEFIERFVKFMVPSAGATFADGSSIEEYARETAAAYWNDKSQRECGPEECAEGDMDCWERA